MTFLNHPNSSSQMATHGGTIPKTQPGLPILTPLQADFRHR